LTPQQAQELAELFDDLAAARSLQATVFGPAPTKRELADLKARLAKLLESVHAG
jgi:hypothetical protein